jgi:hypothetical protein
MSHLAKLRRAAGRSLTPLVFLDVPPPLAGQLIAAAKHDGVTTGARIAGVRPVRHYHLADRPERESSELHMRPREGNADDRAGKENGGDEMAERQPPPGNQQPHEVAENTERSHSDVTAL